VERAARVPETRGGRDRVFFVRWSPGTVVIAIDVCGEQYVNGAFRSAGKFVPRVSVNIVRQIPRHQPPPPPGTEDCARVTDR